MISYSQRSEPMSMECLTYDLIPMAYWSSSICVFITIMGLWSRLIGCLIQNLLQQLTNQAELSYTYGFHSLSVSWKVVIWLSVAIVEHHINHSTRCSTHCATWLRQGLQQMPITLNTHCRGWYIASYSNCSRWGIKKGLWNRWDTVECWL